MFTNIFVACNFDYLVEDGATGIISGQAISSIIITCTCHINHKSFAILALSMSRKNIIFPDTLDKERIYSSKERRNDLIQRTKAKKYHKVLLFVHMLTQICAVHCNQISRLNFCLKHNQGMMYTEFLGWLVHFQ